MEGFVNFFIVSFTLVRLEKKIIQEIKSIQISIESWLVQFTYENDLINYKGVVSYLNTIFSIGRLEKGKIKNQLKLYFGTFWKLFFFFFEVDERLFKLDCIFSLFGWKITWLPHLKLIVQPKGKQKVLIALTIYEINIYFQISYLIF